MKYNSLILRAILFISIAGISFSSCKKSFLDLNPQGGLDENILKNKNGVNTLLIGAYAALDGGRGLGYNNCGSSASCVASIGGGAFSTWNASPSNFLFGSIAAGEAHKGAGAGSEIPMIPFQRWNSMDAANSYVNTKWNACFEGVARANSVLKILLAVTDITDDERKSIAGQARAIRAHFYFDLKKNFNMVPWIDENTKDFAQKNDQDVLDNVIADFKYAFENLPETFADAGRINKWGAASYLGKAYVFKKNYTEAAAIFTQVITNGKTTEGVPYQLAPKFNNNFDAATENNSESVFVAQMVGDDGTQDVGNSNSGDLLNFSPALFGCCGIFIPSQDLVNSYRTGADGLPLLDNYNQSPVKSDQGLASNQPFVPDAGNLDPRLDWTVGRRGIPFLDWGVNIGKDWIRDQDEAGPYLSVKNVHKKATASQYANSSVFAPGNAINLNYLRFADVLLLAAETEANLNNLAKAEEYVNRIRNRAANPSGWVYKYLDNTNPTGGFSNVPAANYVISPYTTGTFALKGKAFALKAIYFERKLELGLEGHRYYDISRWGIASQVMTAYYAYESPLTTDLVGANFVSGKNEYYPIPQAQIDLTRKNGEVTLKQNPNY